VDGAAQMAQPKEQNGLRPLNSSTTPGQPAKQVNLNLQAAQFQILALA
jgi:hypothetical protein